MESFFRWDLFYNGRDIGNGKPKISHVLVYLRQRGVGASPKTASALTAEHDSRGSPKTTAIPRLSRKVFL